MIDIALTASDESCIRIMFLGMQKFNWYIYICIWRLQIFILRFLLMIIYFIRLGRELKNETILSSVIKDEQNVVQVHLFLPLPLPLHSPGTLYHLIDWLTLTDRWTYIYQSLGVPETEKKIVTLRVRARKFWREDVKVEARWYEILLWITIVYHMPVCPTCCRIDTSAVNLM